MSFEIVNAYKAVYQVGRSSSKLEDKRKFIDGVINNLEEVVAKTRVQIAKEVYETEDSLSKEWQTQITRILALPKDDVISEALERIKNISQNLLREGKIRKLCEKHKIKIEDYNKFVETDYPLVQAVKEKRIDMATLLLELGQTVNQQVICQVLENDFVEMLRLFVKWDADIQKNNVLNSNLLLIAAVQNNSAGCARYLVEELKADINRSYDDKTLLTVAVDKNQPTQVNLCISLGADVNKAVLGDIDRSRKSPLMIAIENKNQEMIDLLVRKKANVNLEIDDETPLMVAVSQGDAVIVEKLIQVGAEVNQKTLSGSTSLIRARQVGNQEIAGLLENAGADKNYAEEWLRNKKKESIRNNLIGIKNAIHRWGVVLTVLLPFSARGVIVNMLASPLLIPVRFFQSIGSNFWEKFKNYVISDWNKGIEDTYVDLEYAEKERIDKVTTANFRYAFYLARMSKGMVEQDAEDGSASSILIPKNLDTLPSDKVAEPHLSILRSLQRKFLNELEFEITSGGDYLHRETGVIFKMVYDSERKEIVLCLPGLGYHAAIGAPDEVGAEAVKAAGADWMGGIPPSARQIMVIGRILKEATAGSDLIPVMVGVSHGGGLAQTGAVANGIKGVVFNARPMGAGTRRYIGQLKIAENAKYITAFSGKGDWLSGNKAINALAIIFERVTGIAVPRTVGTGYYLPELSESECPNEMNYSLANHLGFYEGFSKLKKKAIVKD